MRQSGLTIVIKIGSASLVHPISLQPVETIFNTIAALVTQLQDAGNRVILVSSGAVAVGQGMQGCTQRPSDRYHIRALAAVGQTKLMSLWQQAFSHHNRQAAQVLVLNDDHMRTHGNQSALMLDALLQSGIVPIVNENDAIAPGTFGGNDMLALMVASTIKADLLAFLTDVDCLYTQNPRLNPQARAIEVVTDCHSLQVDVTSQGSSIGTGGMQTKLLSASIAASKGITTIINHIDNAHNIANIVHNMSLENQRLCSTHTMSSQRRQSMTQARRSTSLHTIILPSKCDNRQTTLPPALSLPLPVSTAA